MNEKVKDILEWVYCIIIALVLALVFRYFIATPTIVKQRSMYPTLQEEILLLLKLHRQIMRNGKQINQILLQNMKMNQKDFLIDLYITI